MATTKGRRYQLFAGASQGFEHIRDARYARVMPTMFLRLYPAVRDGPHRRNDILASFLKTKKGGPKTAPIRNVDFNDIYCFGAD